MPYLSEFKTLMMFPLIASAEQEDRNQGFLMVTSESVSVAAWALVDMRYRSDSGQVSAPVSPSWTAPRLSEQCSKVGW